MPSFINALVAAALTASTALAAAPDVTCKPFKPEGWKASNRARIYWYNNNPGNEFPYNGPGFEAATLPANATISGSKTFILASSGKNGTIDHSRPGTAFKLYTCNSTSLSLSTQTSQSCSHGGCYKQYNNYLQVRNPATGNCLTITQTTANVQSGIKFQACAFDAGVQGQFFETTQQVQYSPGYESLRSYGPSTFDVPLDREFRGGNGPIREQFSAWGLDRRDNLTIVVDRANYTQQGLSATLYAA